MKIGSQRPLKAPGPHFLSLKGLTRRNNPSPTRLWDFFLPFGRTSSHPATAPPHPPSLVSIACSQTHRLSRLGWGRSGDSVLDHPGHLRKGDGTPWPSLLRENFPSEVPRLRGSKVKFKMLEKMEGPPVPRVAASPPPQRTGKRRPLEAEQRGLRAAFWGNSIKEIIFPQTKPRIA